MQDPSVIQTLDQELGQQANNLSGPEATDSATTAYLMTLARAELAEYSAGSDELTANLGGVSSVESYFAVPRVIMFSTRVDSAEAQPAIAFKMDLIRDSIWAIAAPGQNVQASFAFASSRGIADSELENEVLPAVQGGQNLSAISIISQAVAQGIPLVPIDASTITELGPLTLPSDAKARIVTAVALGMTVIVPSESITINGVQTTAWFEENPSTGETVAVAQDGGHESFISYSVVLSASTIVIRNSLVQFIKYSVVPATTSFIATITSAAFIARVKQAIAAGGTVFGAVDLAIKTYFGKNLGLLADTVAVFGFASGGISAIFKLLTKIDPPVLPIVSGLKIPFSGLASDSGEVNAAVTPSLPTSGVVVSRRVAGLEVSGLVQASWTSDNSTSLTSNSFTAQNGIVNGLDGGFNEAGTVSYLGQGLSLLSFSGLANYRWPGTATSRSYGPAPNLTFGGRCATGRTTRLRSRETSRSH